MAIRLGRFYRVFFCRKLGNDGGRGERGEEGRLLTWKCIDNLSRFGRGYVGPSTHTYTLTHTHTQRNRCG